MSQKYFYRENIQNVLHEGDILNIHERAIQKIFTSGDYSPTL